MTAVLRALLEVMIYAAVLYGAIALFRRLLGARPPAAAGAVGAAGGGCCYVLADGTLREVAP